LNKEQKITGNSYLLLFAGAILYAFSVALVLETNQLAPGGVSGLSIIINHYTGISVGTLILLLNIPLIILGIKKFGFSFFYLTILTLLVNAVFIHIFENFTPPVHDMLLASICGGTLDAVSLGMIFRQGGTTGGTDIVAKLLRLKLPRTEMGKLYIMVDMVVVILSAFAFRNIENAIYSAICVVITGTVLDRILYGNQSARMLIVISDRAQTIGKRMLHDLDTGVTYLNGRGGYTFREKNVIICIIRKRLLPKMLDMIKEEDESAFVIITSADKIVGKGYQEERI
jgi:uncharacterized membrane-anchored protein YitT (DUF2179 family)